MSEERTPFELRTEKLQRLRELGADPYLVERFDITLSAKEMKSRFESLEGQSVSFAGRIISLREAGKATFAHLSDGDGSFQIYLKRDDVGDTAWEITQLLDLGDHVGVTGELFTTRTGEPTIHVRTLTPLSKCMHILPIAKEREGQTWYGLTDVEQRYRHRHLDLITNKEAREMLLARARIVSAVRRVFESWGYLEVETPMLQVEAGGAAARAFNTHYNAYDMDVKLRISLELYLKRIICGDVPRVFEVGRVFRNEGVSNRHSPEFTLLEFYEAYTDLEGMMKRVEDLFARVAHDVFGTTEIELVKGGESEGEPIVVDFAKPWARVDLLTEIGNATGLTPDDLSSLDKAKAALGNREVINPITGKRINADTEAHLGGLIEKLLEVFVEPHLQQPTFVVGYPLETSPLAKKDPQRPGFTRRFEGYMLGREICNAFSEINDPADQRERFEAQVRERARGDDEAHPMDEEFLYALECGMPPTGGCGIGMDRMAM
ncbi:MAG: lysine--tRNA ligase, partial [Fimbriimonadaceae bacterium]|nr:lysine--tRNA ligase [Fimbriimonadaceae bacterium]